MSYRCKMWPLVRAAIHKAHTASEGSAEQQLEALVQKCRFPTSLIYTPMLMQPARTCVLTGTRAPTPLLLRMLPLPRVPVTYFLDRWHMHEGRGRYAIADPRAVQAFESQAQTGSELVAQAISSLRDKCLDLVRGLREKGLCEVNASLRTLQTIKYQLLLIASDSQNMSRIRESYAGPVDTTFSSRELFDALNNRKLEEGIPPYNNLYAGSTSVYLSTQTPGISHLGCTFNMYSADLLITFKQLRTLQSPVRESKKRSQKKNLGEQDHNSKSPITESVDRKRTHSSSDEDEESF